MNTTETIKLMLKSLELVDEAMPFPVAKAGIQAGKDWLERGREPVAFGSVTVRRLSQRFENHHDQYQFYPAGQSPYLDNVDECHTVYTTQPHRKPLSDEEIWKFWWSRPEVEDGEDDSMEAEFVAAVRRVLAAHGIKE